LTSTNLELPTWVTLNPTAYFVSEILSDFVAESFLLLHESRLPTTNHKVKTNLKSKIANLKSVFIPQVYRIYYVCARIAVFLLSYIARRLKGNPV
jgi:hypothetical protein